MVDTEVRLDSDMDDEVDEELEVVEDADENVLLLLESDDLRFVGCWVVDDEDEDVFGTEDGTLGSDVVDAG